MSQIVETSVAAQVAEQVFHRPALAGDGRVNAFFAQQNRYRGGPLPGSEPTVGPAAPGNPARG